MARIAGITYNKTATGKVKSVTIDLKKWGQYLEDFLDIVEIERVNTLNGPGDYYTLEQSKKITERKRKI